MRQYLLRILTAIQLTRLTIAFGAVSDLWFVILATKAQSTYPYIDVTRMHMGVALFAGAVVAIGLFAYGASLNDVLDVRHDSAFSPERPIPAGRIRVGQATVVTVGALIVAVLGGAGFGTWSVCITLLTAAGLLFYNAAGKYIPAVGFVTIGIIHAAHMLIPNPQFAFTLPIWLVMTHSIIITMLVHRYEDKRPRISRRTLIATGLGWLSWSIIILGAGWNSSGSLWPAELPWWHLAYPALAVVAFVLVGYWKTSKVGDRAAAEKLKRYGAMWQSLYGAAWLLALDLTTAAMWIGLFALAGFGAMTIIKEITGLSVRPVTYRA